jgi:HD-like signal output (HDOD) protein/prolyl-tRNA editing enzyme YbaK/EbsC (Cys-tRNA(Pro) deacylase)
MAIASTVRSYLAANGVKYAELPHPQARTLEEAAEAVKVPLSQVARAVILSDGEKFLMAVLPASYVLEFAALGEHLWRDLELASAKTIAAIFKDCEPLSFPPLGAAYGIQAVCDRSLLDAKAVYFQGGHHDCLLCVSGTDFQKLHADNGYDSFARPLAGLRPGFVTSAAQSPPSQGGKWLVTQRIVEKIQGLPAMPQMVTRILAIRNDPRADAEALARVVELDPSLALQVMRYASSAYYGYRGNLSSIRDAIARVLGFDMVLHLALGLAAGKAFRIPREGPLGLNAYWREAVYSAMLCQQLATLTRYDSLELRGSAYLCGLLHNFGYLLIGHLVPKEFAALTRLILANPEVQVTDLERHVMGVGHEQVGAWLTQAWGLPEQLAAAIRWHHRARYQGEHALHVQLVMASDRLLKRYGLGDAAGARLPPEVLEGLGISEEQALLVAQNVVQRFNDLDVLAKQLSV